MSARSLPIGRLLRISAFLALVAGAGALITAPPQLVSQPPANHSNLVGSLNRYSPMPGENPKEEIGDLDQWEAFWTNRLTYPTGKYDPSWLSKAKQQDSLIRSSVPGGRVVYNRTASHSPLALDPTRFTSLGPVGVDVFGRTWSGRVNSIAFDPVITSTAYLAVNGAGIWKTTNCCSEATTFAPVTDVPEVPIIGVDDVIVDPHDHNVVYAGTGDLNFTLPQYPSAGVLKSTDQGASWQVLGADVFAPPYPQPAGLYPQDQAIGKVRIDPRDSQKIVAGTAKGLYFTYDGGQNWTGPCFTNSYSTQRQDTTGLLLRDNGSSTDIYTAVGSRAFSVTIHPIMAENGADGIYRASMPESGCPASWSLISRPDNGWPAGTGSGIPRYQSGNPVGRIDLSFAPSTTAPGNPNVTIYAQAQSAQTLGQLGLWRSTDGGTTWERRSDVSALGGCGFDWPQNWFDQFVTVDPVDANKVYMGTFEVWRSTDGGTTLHDITCSYAGGVVHPDEHALAIAPGAPNVLLDGNDGGVYLSTDGGESWIDLNSSMSTLEFYGGDITANFATSPMPAAAGGTQDNGSMANEWTSVPAAARWQQVLGGDGFWSRIEPVNAQRWYVEANGNGQRLLYMSETGPHGSYQDISGNWRGIGGPILPYEIYKNDCPPTGCTHIIIGTNKVQETTTGAGDWVTVSPIWSGFVTQLSYSVSLSTTAMVGMSNGQVKYGFGLGQGQMATWVDVSGGNALLPNRPIMDVATDPNNPLVGYAGVGGFDENTPSTPGHVFMVTCSTNCASYTWQNKSGNLPDMPVNTIIANPLYPQQVFAGTDWGLYYTDDITAASPTWARFDAGLPHVMVWDMSIDAGFTTLSVWTRSRGAYVWPLSSGAIGGTPTPTGSATVTPTRSSTPVPTWTVVVTPTSPPASTSTSSPTSSSTPTHVGTATAIPTQCVAVFSDVQPTDYFYPAVQYLYCHRAISGYSDGTFRPYNNTTRGQLAKIVVLAEGWPIHTPGMPTFRDVPVGSPFFDFIETAYSRQIISGYTCGTGCLEFRPGNNVTRAQLTKIVVLAQNWTISPPTTPTFSDVPDSDPFYGYIETAYAHNVISGYTCGTGCLEFRPGNSATRGQIAKIVYNAVSAP